MSLFGFIDKQVTDTVIKSAISKAEAFTYVQGGNKPTSTRSFQAYIEASSRLDTVIRTAASIASSAKFSYGREDSKKNFKEVKFAQADGLYMNDYQSEGDWLFELFGTLLTYDKVVIVPEESSYKYRKGMLDWTILPDDKIRAEVGDSQTITEFVYTSSAGQEIKYAYEDCIYISRNLTANNLIYAIPRLKALMKTIENILGIHNFVGEYVSSGGKNSIIASSDALLSEDQSRQVKNALNQFLRSNKPQAMLLNSEKFSLNKVSDSLSTSGVLDIMTQLSNEIMKAFNMPSYLLGEYSSSTQGMTVVYANRTWFEIQLRPLFNTISAAFTRYFRDSLGVKNAVVKFDYSNISLLEDSDTEKLDIVERSVKLGTMSINEGRAMMGWLPLNTEAANLHHVAAYLLGVNPVSYENFEADVARNNEETTNAQNTSSSATSSIPSGDGGSNNTQDLGGRV